MRVAQYTRAERGIAAADDYSWYVEQERRIQAAVEHTRQVRREINCTLDPGHVYVIEFASGLIKVGKTRTPADRVRSHRKWAGVYGDEITRTWISARFTHQSVAEKQLIDYCRSRGRAVSSEYFMELDFDAVSTFGVAVEQAAVGRDETAERVEHDQKRSEYLAVLVNAADDDLSMTWQAAHRLAFGGDVE